MCTFIALNTCFIHYKQDKLPSGISVISNGKVYIEITKEHF